MTGETNGKMAPGAKIISHMNADHQDSLRRYLEHKFGLNSFNARNARLVDVDLSSLRITTNANPAKASINDSYTVVLDPPMKSFSDARSRLADLDHEAIAALGRNTITIKKYEPPQGAQWVVMIACILTFVLLHRRTHLDPATAPRWIRQTFISRFPKAFAFLWNIQPKVFWPMLAIHVTEATWMARTRLAPHSVPLGSKLWLLWMASTFLEGFKNFQRFDEMVAAEKKRRETKQH